MIQATYDPLFELFFLIRHQPGWLADCHAAGFAKDDIDYLDHLADEMAGYEPRADVEAWDREIEREGGYDIYFAETEDEKIKILSERIAHIYQDYERQMRNDGPYQDRFFKLKFSGVEQMERLRRSVRGRQLHTHQSAGGMKDDRITDQDIERARAYPLERLIPDFEMAKFGYIRCRWHEDKKPSMLVKNGFAYCFSCNKAVDSIRWLMEVENMGFVDAVKALRNG